MSAPVLSISRRIRSTPFTPMVEAAGVKGYTVYNHMLLPTFFESAEADYHHLKQHVQVWDVGAERQVEIFGPDAEKLVQLMTPRDLSKAQVNQCFYIPMVDERGGMLNDPVAIKHADNRFWISIADSDVLFWAKGLAYGSRFEVDITEPDIWPLGIQGPKSDELASRVFGEEVRKIRFFRGEWLEFQGHRMFVARSGYSKQGGYEVYVNDAEIAKPLWDALFEAGADLNVRAGGPNLIERIEGGLLSYGNDMTRDNTPYECGLGRFCDTMASIGSIGRNAILRERTSGSARMIRGLRIAGERVPPCRDPWPLLDKKDERVGQVTSAAWSPDLNTNVAIGMVDRGWWAEGEQLRLIAPDGERTAEVCALPFKQAGS